MRKDVKFSSESTTKPDEEEEVGGDCFEKAATNSFIIKRKTFQPLWKINISVTALRQDDVGLLRFTEWKAEIVLPPPPSK